MHPNHLLFLLSSTLFLPLHCFYQSTATEHKTKSTMQEHEKIAALKPVASRPFSSFKSFSKLLKDAAGSPPITILEETNLIRPKTTRFRSLPSDLPTEITATIDAGSGIILGEIEGDTEQVVSCDHLKTSHAVSVWKPMVSVKNRLSYDGYNWRKYGQKQVKGSEFPRSYYKCTHSSCCVKRKVETTIDGQIAEIVYSGEHNHPKPHPPMRPMPLTSTDVVGAGVHGTNNASAGSSNCFDEFGKMIELTVKKKSTRDKQSSNASSLAAYIDPTPTSETWTNYKLSRDAFSWRKYGQKVVKGTSFARSYYRCSAQRCNARKYVERDSPSGSSWVTTYEGRHSHGIPHPP